VTFELMAGSVAEIAARSGRYAPVIRRAVTAWRLDVPMVEPDAGCYHGGASFDAIGPTFDALSLRKRIVVADVLDAWFAPAPGAVHALRTDPDWLARSSPPTAAAGLVTAIASARGVAPESVVVGAGSSDLVFRAFGRWLDRDSRVLLLDPTYGEYAHIVERVIGARVDRVALDRADGWRVDPTRLGSALADGRYDLAVVVNPNNPTGQHLPAADLATAISAAPASTRIWIDEAYLEYAAGPAASLEPLAAASPNVVVCKSMSKVYALSGLRVAYLVAGPHLAAELHRWTPPWPVSLPAQIAAVQALADPAYYQLQWKETARLRGELAADLTAAGFAVAESAANFVLITLPHPQPAADPSAAELVSRCHDRNVLVRDLSAMSPAFEGRTVRITVGRSAPIAAMSVR
jgi:histidinol-phosphate/aromatic aminotransferase/cobyric acid decarboxylase-like protein